MTSYVHAPGVQGRMLIVDDDELQLQVLEAAMLAAGFVVDTSTSGLAAVWQTRSGRYDVVLVDYQLPEIDGLALARLINEFIEPAARPMLIALTAAPANLIIRETGTESAFDTIMGKSGDPAALVSIIRHRLASGPHPKIKHAARQKQLLRDHEEYDAEPCRPKSRGDDPGPVRLLVVEDDEVQRHVISAVFKSEGYDVEAVSDGLEAVRRIRVGCYDLVLIDYYLPEISGRAASNLVLDLMQDGIRPRLVALTAAPVNLNEEERESGSVFDQVVQKSSDFGFLIHSVEKLLKSAPNPATRRAVARLRLNNQLSDL